MAQATQTYRTLDEFYPYYLSEHSNTMNRRLHFIGSSLGLATFVFGLLTLKLGLMLLSFVIGYAFAWVGHFFFEHNKPATFKYPWLSYKGDWRMWGQIATGKIPW